MGGSCIGKIPRKVQKKQKKQNQARGKQNGNTIHYIQLLINTEDLPIQYPSFDLQKNKKRISSQESPTQIPCLIPVRQILSSVKLPFGNLVLQQNYLTTRLYSYQSSQIKKYIQHGYPQIIQHKEKQMQKCVQFHGQHKNFQILSIQLYTAHILNIFLENVAFVSLTSNRCLAIVPSSQDIKKIDFKGYQFVQNMPKKVIYLNNSQNKLHLQCITEEGKVKDIILSLKKFPISQNNMTSNVYFNGFYYCSPSSQTKNSKKDSKIMSIIFKILGQKIDNKNNSKQNLLDHSPKKCHLFLYINPALCASKKFVKVETKRMASYLQIKSYLDLNKNKVFILEQFQKNPVLFSIYIVILSLKILPTFQSTYTRQAYLKSILSLQNDQELLTQFLIFIYLGFLLTPENEAFKLEQAQQLMKKIVKNIFFHIQLLIDAMILEFGLQFDEKRHKLRKNCFSIINSPNEGFTFLSQPKFIIQPNSKLILCLVSKKQQIQHIALNTKALTLTDIEIWEQKTVQIIKKFTKRQEKNQKELLKNLISQKEYEPNKQIIIEYFLGIKIYELFVILMVFPNSKKISMSSTNSIEVKGEMNYEKAFQIWQQIQEHFNNLQFCSGQLGLTILSLQGIIKMLDSQVLQGQQLFYVKAFELWSRMYKDPRTKYQTQSNYWVVLIVQNLINCLKNNGSKQNRRLMQDISYLQNILESIEVNLKNYQFKTSYTNKFNENFIYSMEIQKLSGQEMMKWIIYHIPIRKISSIYFHRLDLCVEEEKSSLWLKTGGSSLFDSPIISNNKGQLHELLSSKSNFQSDLQSNGNSVSRTRTKKNKIKKIHQIVNSSEYTVGLQGIVQWGKGVNSIPMMNPLTKNLDVLKVGCGNYHVVIATTQGIFGWGDNSSGQLGVEEIQENEKQFYYRDSNKEFKKIREICKIKLSSNDKIKISCGNQHTGVLINGTLKMFGQKEGGILGGDGSEFDDISCGGLHTLAIKKGKVYSWGRGQGGQLGHKIDNLEKKKREQSTQFFLTRPTLIPDLRKVKKCVSGDAHSVVLTEEGEVFVFGFSYQGQLGLGLTGESQTFQIFEPIRLTFPELSKNTKIVDIFAGSTFTFLKTSQNEVFSCGINDCFQLGIQKVLKVFKKKKYINRSNKYRDSKMGEIQFSKPRKIQIFKNSTKVNKIFCGQNHCIAKIDYIQDKQMIMGWGLNRNFQISSEFPPQSLAPRTLDNLFGLDFDNVCCGSTFTVGLIKRQQDQCGIAEFQEKLSLIIKQTIGLIV